MGDVAKEGRTVLFVSHNLYAIERICPRSALIDEGRLLMYEASGAVVGAYRRQSGELVSQAETPPAPPGKPLLGMRVTDGKGNATDLWPVGGEVAIDVTLLGNAASGRRAIDLAFYAKDRTRLFYLRSDVLSEVPSGTARGDSTYRFLIKNPGIALSEITVDVGIRDGSDAYACMVVEACTLRVPQSELGVEPAYDGILAPKASGNWV